MHSEVRLFSRKSLSRAFLVSALILTMLAAISIFVLTKTSQDQYSAPQKPAEHQQPEAQSTKQDDITALLPGKNTSLYRDLAKKTLEFIIQVVLVVCIGGILMQNYNRAHARKSAINEFKKEVLDKLIAAYSTVKGARRCLCAKTGPAQQGAHARKIDHEAYHAQLELINGVHLSLEVLVFELRFFPTTFEDTQQLEQHIRAMRDYLNNLIEEYKISTQEPDDKNSIYISRLPCLEKFIAQDQTTDFPVFVNKFKESLKQIQEERIKLA